MKSLVVILVALSLTTGAAIAGSVGRAANTISTRGGEPIAAPARQMPGGPLYSSFAVADKTPATSRDWQSQAIVGWEDNYSPHTAAVGVWGSAFSHAKKAKAWGGFMSAYSDDPQGVKDGQLVGLEVDVANGSLPGNYPNESKSGIQVVGIGHQNTTGLQILSDGTGAFNTGIGFEGSAVTAGGTLIGASGPGPYGIGINLAGVKFSDSALRVGPGQKIRLDSSTTPASIFTEGDKLVIIVPSGGVEYRDQQGNVLGTVR